MDIEEVARQIVDAAHVAMLIYREDGAPACEAFLKRTGLLTDGTFKACLQALLNAIPRTQVKGQFVRPEAEVLDACAWPSLRI
ncbi:MAG: hypothetical protein ACETWR_21745 [Anaerolineae bacterium]